MAGNGAALSDAITPTADIVSGNRDAIADDKGQWFIRALALVRSGADWETIGACYGKDRLCHPLVFSPRHHRCHVLISRSSIKTNHLPLILLASMEDKLKSQAFFHHIAVTKPASSRLRNVVSTSDPIKALREVSCWRQEEALTQYSLKLSYLERVRRSRLAPSLPARPAEMVNRPGPLTHHPAHLRQSSEGLAPCLPWVINARSP